MNGDDNAGAPQSMTDEYNMPQYKIAVYFRIPSRFYIQTHVQVASSMKKHSRVFKFGNLKLEPNLGCLNTSITYPSRI